MPRIPAIKPSQVLGLALSGLLLAACSERPAATPMEPKGPQTPISLGDQAALSCTVSLRSRSMSCGSPTPELPSNGNGLIVGGQGTYVQLTSSNLAYDEVTGAFEFDVSVQNLIAQAMGTWDGATPQADGVRVFFHTMPVQVDPGEPGTITVDNADGTDTFTSADQPYYLYDGALLGGDEILSQNETSGDKRWKFTVPSTISTFRFFVFVSAEVQYPDGYVDLNVSADTLFEGGTTPLTGTVRSAVGNEIIDATIEWGTSNAGVATVDGNGLITAVAPGTATITATSGIRTGTATIAVCPDLAVGEVYTAEMPAAADLCFAGGESGNAEYTYMPVNLSTSSSLSLTLTASGIIGVTGPPSPDMIGGMPLALGLGAHRTMEQQLADNDLHLQMREQDRREAIALAARKGTRTNSSALSAQLRPNLAIVPGIPTVGDLWDLNVAEGCAASDLRTGRVRSIGTHVIIVADTTNPAGGFTTAQYDSIRLEFDTIAYPVNADNFGAPTDRDGNGRVVIFFTRAMNELSPPASSLVVHALVRSRDLRSPADCATSNDGELIYALVPDPTGAVNSNVRTVSFVRGIAIQQLGHELQHLINASRRLDAGSSLEETWLDEGLSYIAEELMFYRTSVGLEPRNNIVVTNLTTGPNASRRVAAFNTYGNPNFGRLRGFLQRPDTTNAFKTNSTLSARGALWSFLRYSADRLGGTESTTWFNLVNSSNTGRANLQGVLGTNPDVWLRDWIAAMYADDAVAGISTEYQNPSWNYRSIYVALNGSHQIVPRPLTNGVALTLSYSRDGGTAYARFGVPTGGFAGVTALSGGVPPTSPFSLIVMRTK